MEESREEWSVHEWLEKAGMGEYIESFVDNGYDTPDLCAELQNDDLTAIGVKDKKHRSIIFSKARELLKLLSTAEITDGPVNTPAEPIVVVQQLDTSSPTLPNNATGSYTEPWPSYTEPWAAGSSNGVPIKLRKTGSDDKPPLPPPNKTKKKHPPPSPLPKDLPAFKRPEGGETGLTKLQLQLKIREELRGEGILLSEAPYVDEEEQMCSQPLSDLAERYSQKLKLQPLDVYDALRVVWNSENSCNVTPLTPASAVDKGHPLTVILKGNSTENYDEPFDAADTAGVTPDCLKPQSSPKGGSKSHTLPPPSNGSTGNYDEPFDAVNKQQQPSSPQQQRQQLESSPERRRIEAQSKTLPSSPKITSKTAAAEDKHDDKKKSKHSSADGDASPKHGQSALAKLFRRKDKGRSHSIQEFDMKQREEKKSGKKGAKISFPMRSKDTLSVGKAQKKKNGSSPRNSKNVCVESSSETDEGSSPQPIKKHSGIKFKKFITPPTIRRDECPLSGSSSSNDSTPETVRKLRAIRSRGLTGSDLEISFRDDGETEKPWMVMSRSFDNLNDINRSAAAPSVADNEKKKEGNIFSRIFKIRTLQSPSRRKTANKEKSKKKGASANRSSLGAGYEGLAPPDGGQSSLANSLSMPDIAAVTPDKRKKNRKPFISSSHTPPEHLSDAEPTTPSAATSPQHLATPEDARTNIPVPKPRTLSRTQSPNSDVGMGAFGGSAPIKPSYLSSESRPIPEPRPRSKTPTSAEGSKSQSPNTSGSDIAMLDSSRSNSTSSQKSLGVPKKPPPPPKPAKITVLNERSTEPSYKFSTLPHGRGVGTTAVKEGGSPPRPIKQFSVPNGDNDQAALSQSVPSRILREREAKKVPPTKPVRNFPVKADLQQEAADTTTPLSSSAVTRRPGGGDGGDTGETSLPGSGSSARVGQTAASSSSPPTPRQRPPPKPARSIKRKPQRDRANAVVNRGGEEQTSTPKEVERPVSGGATPPRSNSDSSSDKMVVGGGGGGETAPTSSGPPKPIRRIKTPKVVDSSSPQMEEEKEKNSGTFGDRDQSSSSGCGTRNGSETNTKHAVRTINVSTPSPTSSSPTTPNDSSSFAEAAEFPHNTSATTAEVTKSTHSRFEAGDTSTPLSSTVASRSGSGGAGSKPLPKPKPRSLQHLGSQGSFSGGSSLGNGGSGTPRRPVPPNKPSRSSVKIATPEHCTT